MATKTLTEIDGLTYNLDVDWLAGETNFEIFNEYYDATLRKMLDTAPTGQPPRISLPPQAVAGLQTVYSIVFAKFEAGQITKAKALDIIARLLKSSKTFRDGYILDATITEISPNTYRNSFTFTDTTRTGTSPAETKSYILTFSNTLTGSELIE